MRIGQIKSEGHIIPVYECEICKSQFDDSAPRVDGDNGETYCGDCAFISGLINESEYINCFCYWIDAPKLRACVKDGVIPLASGKFEWEKKPERNRGNEYKDWRKAVFERDRYTCQHCGKVGGELNAHHIKAWKSFPELRFEVSNGQTLCADCHREYHREHGK